MRIGTSSQTKQGSLSKRMIMGFAAVAGAAVVGTAGLASAANAAKPSTAECQKAGFQSYNQCVKEWKQGRNTPNVGYGNGNQNNVNTDTDININVEGDGNTVQVILNYVFG